MILYHLDIHSGEYSDYSITELGIYSSEEKREIAYAKFEQKLKEKEEWPFCHSDAQLCKWESELDKDWER